MPHENPAQIILEVFEYIVSTMPCMSLLPCPILLSGSGTNRQHTRRLAQDHELATERGTCSFSVTFMIPKTSPSCFAFSVPLELASQLTLVCMPHPGASKQHTHLSWTFQLLYHDACAFTFFRPAHVWQEWPSGVETSIVIGQTNAVLVETLAAVCAWTANDVRLKVQQAEDCEQNPKLLKSCVGSLNC